MHIEKNWIDDIVETTLRNFNNRRIILWGKYIVSDEIKKRLEHYNITDIVYVDEDEDKQDNCEVFSTQMIDGKSDSCYIIVPVGIYDSIRENYTKRGIEIPIFIILVIVLSKKQSNIMKMHMEIR